MRKYLDKLGISESIVQMEMVYKYKQDGTLNRGNVKYIAKLADGDAYVLLYSENIGSVYDCYQCGYGFAKNVDKKNPRNRRWELSRRI